MSLGKKSLSVFLSFILALSLIGTGFAYADPLEDQSSAELAAEGESATDAELQKATDEEAGEIPDATSDETEEALLENASEDEADDEPVVADPHAGKRLQRACDVVEFVYLDANVVALDQEQNIAFSLLDEKAVISSAEIEFLRGDTQEKEVFTSETMADNAALFTMVFDDENDATSYTLQSIIYQIEGSEEVFCADFTYVSENAGDNSYCFDVVTPEVYAALHKEVGEEGEVTAFAIKDDGELVAADSVEEAIVVSDAEGVYDEFEAGDSIVLEAEELSEDDTLVLEEDEVTNEPFEPLSIIDAIASYFEPQEAYAAASKARENYLIVALDPGHGGSDPGAKANGLVEKDINWKIAQSCKSTLEGSYTGVSAPLTRGQNEYVGLQARVDRAVTYGADVFVSLHNNMGGGTGAEVWVPNASSYNKATHTEGTALGNKILAQLAKLNLESRGVKTRDADNGEKYPGGGVADYYSVINGSRYAGMPGIIVEHAFMDNASDAAKLKDASFLTKLGKADAAGIANQYGLIANSEAKKTATVAYRAHVSNLGWEQYVYDQKVAGTVGKARGVEAFNIKLQNQKTTGGIQYRAYVGSGWQSWVSNDAMAGTTGKSKSIQAIQVKLTGDMAKKYDVYYRVHAANVGWLGWAKNGASAGSIGYGYAAEAMEVKIVPAGTKIPESTATPLKQKNSTTVLKYQAHVANIGWQPAVKPAATAGTTGKNLAMEAFKISIPEQKYTGGIKYSAHVANEGWQAWKNTGNVAGTTGKSRQMEAIKIELTGKLAENYDIYYRAHVTNFGWLDWAKNGDSAGSEGYGYSLQAVQIKLVAKGGTISEATTTPFQKKGATNDLRYKSHVSNIGWQPAVKSAATSGTTGKNLPMEAFTASFQNQKYTGGISYRAHVSNIGWQGWKADGAMAGTTGQARQMEAIEIKLTGTMATKYDIYYRVHCTNIGWTGWAKNGASCGSSGYGYSMQAIQIKLVAKNTAAPGSTNNPYYQKGTPIMGTSQTTISQMVNRYNAMGYAYPSAVYTGKGAKDITQFCTLLYQEAQAEGVRAEVVFAQAMHETGWLQFGGDVKVGQYNFAGIGATGGVPGNTFSNVKMGLRAQVQHLKAYASTAPLNNPREDPRFAYVVRGSAPTVEALGGKWATGSGYGSALVNQINALLASKK